MLKFHTSKEICNVLQVRLETLHKWRKAGMPYKRLMRTIRYDLTEVLEWIENQNKSTEESRR